MKYLELEDYSAQLGLFDYYPKIDMQLTSLQLVCYALAVAWQDTKEQWEV